MRYEDKGEVVLSARLPQTGIHHWEKQHIQIIDRKIDS